MLDNNNQYNRPIESEIQKISINDLGIEDKKCWLVSLSAFLFPILGLGLYLVWKDYKPVAAKNAVKWGIIGFASSIVLQILFVIFYLIFYMMMFNFRFMF